jgi:hypothetical protein
MFFAAITSAPKIDPQLVQTKRDRLMRLSATRHCNRLSAKNNPSQVPYAETPNRDNSSRP